MEKVMIVNTDKCTGCRQCEMVCSMAKLGEFNPQKAYIRVLKNKEMDVNLVTLSTRCNFCGECVEACLPQAIQFVNLDEAILKWKGTKIGSMPAPLFCITDSEDTAKTAKGHDNGSNAQD